MSQAYIQHTPLVCKSCGHTWEENTLANVLVEVFVAHIRSIRCPKCHADYNHIGFAFEPLKIPAKRAEPAP